MDISRLRYLGCLGRGSSWLLLETFADFFKVELYSDDSINTDSQVKEISKFVYLGWLGSKEGVVVMRKVLSSILVSAAFCFEASFVQAQNLPSGQGPRPIAEPIPLGGSNLGNQGFPNSGPMGNPQSFGEPEEAPLDLSLSGLSPSAFMEEPPLIEFAWYGSIGARALQRQNNGSLGSAYQGDGDVVGAADFARLPEVQNFNQLNPAMGWGPTVTLGFLENNHMLEFYGFYIPQNSTSISNTDQGRLSSPFGSSPPPPYAPAGFQGLWLNADTMTTTMNSAIGNAELNYRYASPGIKDVEFMFGVRYFDILENMIYSTNRSGDINTSNPKLEANYNARAHNHILGLQVGSEYNHRVFKHLGIGMMTKGSAGVNWWNSQVSLVRGDGLEGFSGSQNGATFASILEMGFYADILLLERARFRAGYNVLWAIGMAEASSQYNYNLRETNGSSDIGTIFYQGPTLELQFLF